MFTFGLFTTHIPYIAFVVSFVYFMFSGANEVHNGKIRTSDRSILVEYQVNDLEQTSISAYDFQNHQPGEPAACNLFTSCLVKQKWKLCRSHSLRIHDGFVGTQFSRPPPSVI